MNSKWILTCCAIGVFALAQSANGQGDCGCDNGYSKTRSICQGYTQARAESLWGGYCGEKCWGELGDDCGGCQLGGRLRGAFSRGCNTGCNSGGGFGWGNRGCDSDCNTGCGFKFRMPSFFNHGCRERCSRDLFGSFRGMSLGCNKGCNTGCNTGSNCFGWGNCGDCGSNQGCGCGGGGLQLLSKFGNRCNDRCNVMGSLRGMFSRSGYGGCCDKGCNSGCNSGCGEQANANTVEPAAVEPKAQEGGAK